MVLGIFRSRLRPGAEADYEPVAERMSELAQDSPGYVFHKTFAAPDGERVTLFGFETDADLLRWREHPEHQEAQRRGRNEFYSTFSLQVCEVIRERGYE